MKGIKIRRSVSSQRGSLALEQVLFIAAIAAMATGLYAFYGSLSSYFEGFSVPQPPGSGGPVE